MSLQSNGSYSSKDLVLQPPSAQSTSVMVHQSHADSMVLKFIKKEVVNSKRDLKKAQVQSSSSLRRLKRSVQGKKQVPPSSAFPSQTDMLPVFSLLTAITPIEHPLQLHLGVFLQNDIYVELSVQMDVERGVRDYRAQINSFRPVSRVRFEKSSGFLSIELDQSNRGIRDFTSIITILDSMQSQQMHEFALRLGELAALIADAFPKQFLRRQNSAKNQELLQRFREIETPKILEEMRTRDPSGFYVYQINSSIEDILDQSETEFGLSENLINLLGTDVNEYTSLLFRQGWFDFANWTDRNGINSEYTESLNVVFKNNFDVSHIALRDTIKFCTLDGVECIAKISPQIHFCYADYQEDLFPSIRAPIAFMYIYKLTLSDQSKMRIVDARSSHSSRQRPAIKAVYENPSISLQHFFYSCSTQHFQNFNKQHSGEKKQRKKKREEGEEEEEEEEEDVCGFKDIHDKEKPMNEEDAE